MRGYNRRSLFRAGAAMAGTAALGGGGILLPNLTAVQAAPAGPDCGTEYRGSQPRSTTELGDWHARAEAATALEPALPIVDPHHHLFGSPDDRLFYELGDLQRDLDSGHRIIGTVYVEAYDSGWRETDPEEMRPVGETEKIVGLTAAPVQTRTGECQVAAGIVCHADLTLGDNVADVLAAHVAAADGRLRGLRHRTATVEGNIACVTPGMPRAHLLVDADFHRGFAQLEAFDLSFDAWIYHTQIGELVDLADAFPNTTIVINHIAAPIGVAEFSGRRTETLQEWEAGIKALAERPNTRMKIGGMGMPILGYGFELRETPASATEMAQAWQLRIATCIEVFGTDRCMFESNFPVDKQSGSYCEVWNAFKLATQGASPKERSDLFYRTACRTYRLPALEALGDQAFAE